MHQPPPTPTTKYGLMEGEVSSASLELKIPFIHSFFFTPLLLAFSVPINRVVGFVQYFP